MLFVTHAPCCASAHVAVNVTTQITTGMVRPSFLTEVTWLSGMRNLQETGRSALDAVLARFRRQEVTSAVPMNRERGRDCTLDSDVREQALESEVHGVARPF